MQACQTIPENNREMWIANIRANGRRDCRVRDVFRAAGWSALTLLECQRSEEDPQKSLRSLVRKMQIARAASGVWVDTRKLNVPKL